MDKINDWLVNTLGSWVSDFFGLILIVAAALALILIIMIIAVAVCHAKNKKKLKNLSASAGTADDEKLRAEIRAEIEKECETNANDAKEARAAADAASHYSDGLRAQIAERDRTIDDLKAQNNTLQARIDELGAMLGQANNDSSVNNDLYRQLNELNQTNKELENENNLLKAENAQIKAQALQQQVAAQKTRAATETTAATDTAEQQNDEDDEYDEYYDDYGDENSLVKVTVKFDRVKNNWVVLRSDTDRTYRRLGTKQEALVIAKDLARRLHAQLVVHKKDGKFQRI